MNVDMILIYVIEKTKMNIVKIQKVLVRNNIIKYKKKLLGLKTFIK